MDVYKHLRAVSLLLLAFLATSLAILSSIPTTKDSGVLREAMVIFKVGSVGKALHVELADTPQELSLGLMFREQIGDDEGMLFVFSEERQLSFWMKNTLIPLDMIFINSSKEIVHIVRDAQPCPVTNTCPSYSSVFPAKYVVEANSGFADTNNIGIGQEIEILIEV